MSISIKSIIEKIKNTYIVIDKTTKEVVFSNQKAKSFIGDKNDNIDLNVIFDSTDIIDTFFEKRNVGEIPDIYINMPKQDEQRLVNLYLGYFDEEKNQVYIEIEPKSSVKKMFEAMQKLSPDILFMINVEKHLLFFRGELSGQLGLSENIVNFPHALIEACVIHPEDIDTYLVTADDMLDGIQRSCELRIKLSNGNFNWFCLTSVIVYDDYHKPIKVLGKLRNIQKEKDLQFKMSHDLLTKTLNKISLINCVTEILHASDEGETHALYFIDIDNFQAINEKFSHDFADKLLGNIGTILLNCVRDTDFVGRVGIDEFVVFLPNIVCDEAINKKSEFMLKKLAQEFRFNGDSYTARASIGISKYPNHGNTYNELQKKADIALYASKEKGKNISTIFNDTLG